MISLRSESRRGARWGLRCRMRRPVVWSVFGPNPDRCDSGSPGWTIDRYRGIVTATGGVYVPLVDGEDCALTNFEAALARVAGAL